jgi:flagellar hook-associated protein 3 FlgL
MDATQVALTSIIKDAESFLAQLIGVRDQPLGSDVVQSLGQTRLQALTEVLNTGLDGAYIFAGINNGQQPLVDYYGSGTPSNKAAIDAAFLAEFGFAQTDPAAEHIDAASMQAFLDGAFAQRFEEPAWSDEWSNASDSVIKDMISLSERVPTSVSANDEGLRKLAKAYAMVADLGLNGLNDQAYSVIIQEATRLIGEAVPLVATAQAHLGNSQERIKFANEKIERQVIVLNGRIADMEAIDPYEAHARVLELKTRIEASYELTVRIQNLSLINHL